MTVATVGVFDGVHIGHRALIGRARQAADARGAELVAITFDPHPLAVLDPVRAPAHLATVEFRLELLMRAGADRAEVLHFTREVAAWPPQQFVVDYLVRGLGVTEVVVGDNFRFGAGAVGDVDALAEYGAPHGLRVHRIPLVESSGEPWSSTRIRRLIAEGDVVRAAAGLQRWYRLDGEVVHGDHRGRELGYPTANLQWTGRPAVPADGVYAGWIDLGTERMPAAISVGTNPQFDGAARRVEAHAIGRQDLDLYGRHIGVVFVERLRGQEVFASVDGLVEQMAQDVEAAGTVVGNPREPW